MLSVLLAIHQRSSQLLKTESLRSLLEPDGLFPPCSISLPVAAFQEQAGLRQNLVSPSIVNFSQSLSLVAHFHPAKDQWGPYQGCGQQVPSPTPVPLDFLATCFSSIHGCATWLWRLACLFLSTCGFVRLCAPWSWNKAFYIHVWMQLMITHIPTCFDSVPGPRPIDAGNNGVWDMGRLLHSQGSRHEERVSKTSV